MVEVKDKSSSSKLKSLKSPERLAFLPLQATHFPATLNIKHINFAYLKQCSNHATPEATPKPRLNTQNPSPTLHIKSEGVELEEKSDSCSDAAEESKKYGLAP